jgi:hypothetical protein
MTCAEVQANLSLYLYGELDFAMEEELDAHVVTCPFCQLSLAREKQWHAALNVQQQDPRPEWLTECRFQLHERLQVEPPAGGQKIHAFWDGVRRLFDVRWTGWSYRLAAASFLVILGFGAGRYLTVSGGGLGGGVRADLFAAPQITQVQRVAPMSGNRVRIVVQQVGEVSGGIDDARVRELLLKAAESSLDPGVRMDSVEVLAAQPDEQIRSALLKAVKTDPSAAVRVRAIESLRRFPPDAMTREALVYVLAYDRDPGVRTEAVDVLVPAGGQVQMTPQLLQTIEGLSLAANEDDYVRERCQRVLETRAVHAVY